MEIFFNALLLDNRILNIIICINNYNFRQLRITVNLLPIINGIHQYLTPT